MAIFVKNGLAAFGTLEKENVDIRPLVTDNGHALKILMLNLMPTKQATETQIIRMLSGAATDVNFYLMNTASYTSKNVDTAYLDKFYGVFSDYKRMHFDGLIITGAPIEHLEFEQVAYWDEICDILDWAKENVSSVYSICWGAQAAMYHLYGIKKYTLKEKMFGIFRHKLNTEAGTLTKNIPQGFYAPVSRYTQVLSSDIIKTPGLKLVSESDEAGVFWAVSEDNKYVFVTGHPEYDAETLALEYFRDLKKGDAIVMPRHYFPADDPEQTPKLTWRDTGRIIYRNWTDNLIEKRGR